MSIPARLFIGPVGATQEHGWANTGYVRSAVNYLATCAGDLPMLDLASPPSSSAS